MRYKEEKKKKEIYEVPVMLSKSITIIHELLFNFLSLATLVPVSQTITRIVLIPLITYLMDMSFD